MLANRSVTLVVGDDEDDIGLFAKGGLCRVNRIQGNSRGNGDEYRIYEVTGHGGISFQWVLTVC